MKKILLLVVFLFSGCVIETGYFVEPLYVTPYYRAHGKTYYCRMCEIYHFRNAPYRSIRWAEQWGRTMTEKTRKQREREIIRRRNRCRK